MTSSRLLADRRGGTDRRAVPRRRAVARAREERRRTVDRRRGSERRSTLDRRCRSRRAALEAPGEHLRNALQLLAPLATARLSPDELAHVAAGLERVRRALALLELRSR